MNKLLLYSTSATAWTPVSSYRFRIPPTDFSHIRQASLLCYTLDHDYIYNVTPQNNAVRVENFSSPTVLRAYYDFSIPSGKYSEASLADTLTGLSMSFMVALRVTIPTYADTFLCTYEADSDKFNFVSSGLFRFTFPNGNLASMLGFNSTTVEVSSSTPTYSNNLVMWMSNNMLYLRIHEFEPEIYTCFSGETNNNLVVNYFLSKGHENSPVVQWQQINVKRTLSELHVDILDCKGQLIYIADPVAIVLGFQ